MDNNYNNEPSSFGGQNNEPYIQGGYPQQGAPDYGGAPVNSGYGYPQQGAPNYGGQPMNGGYGYPNGQPYPAPNFYSQFNDPYAQPVPDESGGKGIAALVMGIISWLTFCIPVAGICISLIGLILGIQGRNGSKKGLAIAGIVLSSISLVVAISFFIAFVIQIIREI